jgi:YihY family inner membrane protein
MQGLHKYKRRIVQVLTSHYLVRAAIDTSAHLRLPQTAASLAFLTVLAIVPVASIGLGALTAFPGFAKMREAFEQYLIGQFLLPSVSGPVVKYLQYFSTQTGKLSIAGFAGFLITATLALQTIEKTFELIWRTPMRLSWMKRTPIYWMVLVLGPLIAGALLLITIKLGTPVIDTLMDWFTNSDRDQKRYTSQILSWLPFCITLMVLTMLYVMVPSAAVRKRHAMAGALVAATAIQILKWGLGQYLKSVPTFSTVYGAFAVLPIFLIWLYGLWFCVLLGAVLVASLPRKKALLADQAQIDEQTCAQHPSLGKQEGVLALLPINAHLQAGSPASVFEPAIRVLSTLTKQANLVQPVGSATPSAGPQAGASVAPSLLRSVQQWHRLEALACVSGLDAVQSQHYVNVLVSLGYLKTAWLPGTDPAIAGANDQVIKLQTLSTNSAASTPRKLYETLWGGPAPAQALWLDQPFA